VTALFVALVNVSSNGIITVCIRRRFVGFPIRSPGLLTDNVMSPSPSAIQLSEMETADIQPHVTLEAINRGEFGGVGALELNNITQLDVPEPQFLVEFRAKLKQHRWIKPETVNLFFITCGSSYS